MVRLAQDGKMYPFSPEERVLIFWHGWELRLPYEIGRI
jgi:hypothetical protein